jgi:hypothetical protein
MTCQAASLSRGKWLSFAGCVVSELVRRNGSSVRRAEYVGSSITHVTGLLPFSFPVSLLSCSVLERGEWSLCGETWTQLYLSNSRHKSNISTGISSLPTTSAERPCGAATARMCSLPASALPMLRLPNGKPSKRTSFLCGKPADIIALRGCGPLRERPHRREAQTARSSHPSFDKSSRPVSRLVRAFRRVASTHRTG